MPKLENPLTPNPPYIHRLDWTVEGPGQSYRLKTGGNHPPITDYAALPLAIGGVEIGQVALVGMPEFEQRFYTNLHLRLGMLIPSHVSGIDMLAMWYPENIEKI